MPMAAGMARMRYRTFATYAAVGGLIWGPGSVLLGYLAGGSYQKIAAVAGPAALVLLILLMLISAVTVGARWITKHPERLKSGVARVVDRPRVLSLRRRYRHRIAFVARRLSPSGALLLSLTVSLIAADDLDPPGRRGLVAGMTVVMVGAWRRWCVRPGR